MLRKQAIVQAHQDSVRDETERAERARGITGIREMRRQLEQVSAKKADVDDAKWKSLEEVSVIDKDI
jgi:hypothetical protein